MQTTVIYHADCNDGFTAAWVMHRYKLERAKSQPWEFIPAKYGDEPPWNKITDHNVIIVDFSYPRETLLKISQEARHLRVLDHHKTAQAACQGLPFCVFDMDKCGAALTWRYAFGNDPMPKLVAYVQDHDLAKFELPHSRAVRAYIQSCNWTFPDWTELAGLLENNFGMAAALGETVLRYQQRLIDRAVAGAWPTNFDGHDVRCANVSDVSLTSDVASKLAEGHPFGMTFYQRDASTKVYSLRSSPEGLDVSEIAKAHGGGGHKHAAGFTEKV